MYRYLKFLLATSCFIALGFILKRFSDLGSNILPSSQKIYTFYLDNTAVTIRKEGRQVENVKWKKLGEPEEGKTEEKGRLDKTESRNVLLGKLSGVEKEVRPSVKAEQEPATASPLAAKEDKIVLQAARTFVSTAPESNLPNVESHKIVQCSNEGENLVGPLAVDQSIPQTEDNIDDGWGDEQWVEKGGAWRPTKCQAVSKVAIVVPYRNREQQLKIFLRHMHPILKRQLLDYRIMVIEQAGDTPFNRGMLFNIGFTEALKLYDFKCFVFHDVDLIPENDRNYYGCPSAPRHLSVAIDKFQYRLPYAAIFGGAGAFRKEHFKAINGFSNKFWGWGGEDDDLYKRIVAKGFKLTRPNMVVGRYTMVRIFHRSANADPLRFDKLKDSVDRMPTDGINSLQYKVQRVAQNPLYTKVTVEVDPATV